MLNKKRYCPGCGKFVVVAKGRRLNHKTGWWDREYFLKCSGCGISAHGESLNVFKLFPEVPELPSADEIAKAFEEGFWASFDRDDKQTRFNF